jgi:hypothetical protein
VFSPLCSNSQDKRQTNELSAISHPPPPQKKTKKVGKAINLQLEKVIQKSNICYRNNGFPFAATQREGPSKDEEENLTGSLQSMGWNISFGLFIKERSMGAGREQK